jgi:hypothetical protein
MQQTGIVASLGKHLAGLGMEPDESARLVQRRAQQFKLGFADGARVAKFILRWGGILGYIRSVSCQANDDLGTVRAPTARRSFAFLDHGSPRPRRLASFPVLDIAAHEKEPSVYEARFGKA